jgi:uncharacterized protein
MAARVFADPLRQTRQDRVEGGEARWQTIGLVQGVLLLLVAHTITEDEPEARPVDVIRIISARQVTPKERKRYETDNG